QYDQRDAADPRDDLHLRAGLGPALQLRRSEYREILRHDERIARGILSRFEPQALMVRLREVGRGRAYADAGFSVEQELEKIPVIVGVVIADVILMCRRSGEQRDRNEGDRRAAVGDSDETGRSHTNDRTEVVPDL